MTGAVRAAGRSRLMLSAVAARALIATPATVSVSSAMDREVATTVERQSKSHATVCAARENSHLIADFVTGRFAFAYVSLGENVTKLWRFDCTSNSPRWTGVSRDAGTGRSPGSGAIRGLWSVLGDLRRRRRGSRAQS